MKHLKVKKKKVLGRTKVKIKDAEGRKKKFVYDKQGKLIKDVEVDYDSKGIKKRTTKKIKNNKVVKTKTSGGFAEPFGATSEEDSGFKMYKKGGKAFKPHMMYDPKTGKAFKANKPADHERMSKMGYTHTKPKKKKAGMGVKNRTYLYGGMVPKMGAAKKFISDSAPFSTKVDEYYRSN